ncbi:fluoride efflux transporter CrcB [Pseudooceanicola sediminis]|uniref:Fluoride-specific ion channel FluC n=1 Tax=Pseudooceanicola sediminis TaxID=2211117 RepID=A0A399J4I2_9RHOB|nr:fluoride efflux transporter CrcB [Pseudooceanicola sediminis]KAA2314508.1 fluoride efflux transporter CrcB [Puniceibacterium sp. HSS470]RII39497.1 fluoride efflux transporter CrcB [Pseudooceanicola sediminis]|tara:strand:- start:70036 stop:70419 length:384 start_codon:yes stop_codon:yes gene_type:complete
MILTVFQVALGGAIGASLRYLSGVAILRLVGSALPIPLGVLFVNVLGSFLMGALVVFIGQKELTHLNPLLATGVLGGFTTFSSFSLEAYNLFERGHMAAAATYVGLSLVLSLLAIVLGFTFMRAVLS